MCFNPDKIRSNVLLKDYVTFKLGGPAEFFYQAHTTNDLLKSIEYAKSRAIPLFLLGGGSNLVVSDDGIEGLVIRNHVRDIIDIDASNCFITVTSGCKLSDIVKLTAAKGMSGFEYLAGIPGTIGGAVYGNAGAYGKSISDILYSATILLADGTIKSVDNNFFKFGYRTSRLKKEPIIVIDCHFRLEPGDINAIEAKISDILAQREIKHPPYSIGCAGSFFQNLPPLPGESRRRAAGAVLEQAGAKQMSYGGASVFDKHANFIINSGKAKASDVKILAKMLKEKVKKDCGIQLTEEVLYIGKS